MKRYSVTASTTIEKRFWLFAYGVIGLMLVYGAISMLVPWFGMSDRISHAIGWSAMATLFLAMVLVFVFIAKQAFEQAWRNAVFELDDSKVALIREGWPRTEVKLTQINFLGESKAGLVVRAGEPSNGFFIPRSVSNFEELKQQLCAYCRITPFRHQHSYAMVVPWVFTIVLYGVLFFSTIRAAVLAAGIMALLFQAWAIFSMRGVWAKTVRLKQ